LGRGSRAIAHFPIVESGVGELPEPVRSQIAALPIAQLEALGEALLDFSGLSDLETWLTEQSNR
jgi:hypothetical protein